MLISGSLVFVMGRSSFSNSCSMSEINEMKFTFLVETVIALVSSSEDSSSSSDLYGCFDCFSKCEVFWSSLVSWLEMMSMEGELLLELVEMEGDWLAELVFEVAYVDFMKLRGSFEFFSRRLCLTRSGVVFEGET